MSDTGSISDGSADEDENATLNESPQPKKAKKAKCGIIYLSTIPQYMTVTKVREIFGQFGELGRVFLQPADTSNGSGSKKKKASKHFTEGWVEFKRKKVAKLVAQTLNNTQIGGKKKSKFYDHIWCIKYLPRFKWVHLSERLAYERAVRKQRLRAEISQAKREANYFAQNIDRSEKLKKQKSVAGLNAESDFVSKQNFNYHQRKTDGEIRLNKIKNSGLTNTSNLKAGEENTEVLKTRTIFLKTLFNSFSEK